MEVHSSPIFEAQNKYFMHGNKVFRIAFSLQVIRSFNIMMKEIWFPSKKIHKQDTLVPCVLK